MGHRQLFKALSVGRIRESRLTSAFFSEKTSLFCFVSPVCRGGGEVQVETGGVSGVVVTFGLVW